jgi:ABC-type dipeptide/oligopeptide/nickel transport system ATPase component
MPKLYDFVVDYNPEKDTAETLTDKIIYAVWVRPLKANFPRVIFIGGESGSGKSHTCINLMVRMLKMQGVYTGKELLSRVNVFNPVEYGEKLNALLYDKELKKVNVFAIQEGRQVVRAKLWHSLANQSIGDVNALSRSIKRIAFFILSQFIRDIDNDIRYTLNYYCKAERPINGKVKLYIKVMWKDDHDIEKPQLRTRNLRGYLRMPNGKYRRYSPPYMVIPRLDKETAQYVDDLDFQAKKDVLERRINTLMEQMKLEQGIENSKVPAIIKAYAQDIDNLRFLGKMFKGKWRLNETMVKAFNLSDKEKKELQKGVIETLKVKGYFAEDMNEGVEDGNDTGL